MMNYQRLLDLLRRPHLVDELMTAPEPTEQWCFDSLLQRSLPMLDILGATFAVLAGWSAHAEFISWPTALIALLSAALVLSPYRRMCEIQAARDVRWGNTPQASFSAGSGPFKDGSLRDLWLRFLATVPDSDRFAVLSQWAVARISPGYFTNGWSVVCLAAAWPGLTAKGDAGWSMTVLLCVLCVATLAARATLSWAIVDRRKLADFILSNLKPSEQRE